MYVGAYLTALMSVMLAPCPGKTRALDRFLIRGVKRALQPLTFRYFPTLSHLFPTKTPKNSCVSYTHKIQCFRNCYSCPFDALKHTYYCIPVNCDCFVTVILTQKSLNKKAFYSRPISSGGNDSRMTSTGEEQYVPLSWCVVQEEETEKQNKK